MTYILCIRLDKDINVSVGSLGKLNFKKGTYLYIGSAKKNHASRINRHLRKKKKTYWHIDYLLKQKKVKIFDI